MDQEQDLTDDARLNFLRLQEVVESEIPKAIRNHDPREAKSLLIQVQNQFRGLKLYRDDRENLYARLQEAFAIVNKRIEEEKLSFERLVLENYNTLLPAVEQALSLSRETDDFRQLWDSLLDLQSQIKSAKLFHEQRDELFRKLQEAFETLKTRRNQERNAFELEAQQNYQRLKLMVDDGLNQAETTHEYKETREYLKKIQNEFKGIRMIHEQREELYSRLQTAFDILSKRLDEFFRTKKKNWEIKMNYKLSQYAAEIFEIQEKLSHDRSSLQDLLDQQEIIRDSGKESTATTGIEARIVSTRKSISRRSEEIARLEAEQNLLREKLNSGSEGF